MSFKKNRVTGSIGGMMGLIPDERSSAAVFLLNTFQ
jgi:hypothetical protein